MENGAETKVMRLDVCSVHYNNCGLLYTMFMQHQIKFV